MKKAFLLLIAFYTHTHTQAQVGINTTEPKATLDVEVSKNLKEGEVQGFLPPRMDTQSRDKMKSVPAGVIIFNSTTKSLEVYDGSDWISLNTEPVQASPQDTPNSGTEPSDGTQNENTPPANEIWVKGIVPPTTWEYSKLDTEKKYPFAKEVKGNGSGWYDIDKEGRYLDEGIYVNDENSCWLITASNMLHWWADRNKSNIERYNRNSGSNVKFTYDNTVEKDRDRSNVYTNIRKAFRNYKRGGHPNFVIQWYLSGSNTYPNSLGVFKDVIPKTELLYTSSAKVRSWRDFSNLIKDRLNEGNILAISYKTRTISHVITIWGVRLNNDGNVSDIYVTNSDDRRHGMYRLKVKGNDKEVFFENSVGGGRKIIDVYYLEQGTKFWSDYFVKQGK